MATDLPVIKNIVKVLEKFMCKRLYTFLNNNNNIYSFTAWIQTTLLYISYLN